MRRPDFRFWYFSDMAAVFDDVRYQGMNGPSPDARPWRLMTRFGREA
jgi:hypothetical protein